ncbi:tol-pal system YbgF family protein [Haliscomenobacter sp.]|uniref:tetratricopeptide repeat protein n=1 Tax=Haliscomenobacter sp. TaxID=2717303 RepID=UPI003593A51A
MDEIAQKLIERYHQNALSSEENQEFQRRINSDSDFAKEVQWHGLALEAIRLQGEKELRRRLTVKGKELDAKVPNRSTAFPWQWGLLLIVLLAMGLWSIDPKSTTKEPISPAAPTEKSLPLPPANPKPLDPIPSRPQAQTKPASIDGKKIFAAYFEPYRDASLEPSVRGSAAEKLSPQEYFQQLYWEGKYAAALSAFDSLSTFAQQDNTNLFLKANCLLHARQGNAAATILEGMLQIGHSRFVEQVPWYLALSYLQTGQIEKAKKTLNEIVERKGLRLENAAQLYAALK